MAQRGRAKRREAPEIIVKEFLHLQCTEGNTLALPEIILLANRAGFQHLIDLFTYFATRTVAECAREPENFRSYCSACPDCGNLSDTMWLRIGSLTPTNRKQVLRRYGISARTRKMGDLRGRYRKLMQRAKNEFLETRRLRAKASRSRRRLSKQTGPAARETSARRRRGASR